MTDEVVLNLKNISKAFGGVQALDDVTIKVNRGEIHAVLGENGAGKSTLMKIIAGALHPDHGTIELEGEQVAFGNPREAAEAGIAMVYQEPVFFKELSVVENIYLGNEITQPGGLLDWQSMTAGAAEAVQQMGLPTNIVYKSMSELMLGAQHLVLIAKSIHKNAKILILDEPTAILSKSETDLLFETMRNLRAHGVSILYISHRLEEIFKISDQISILRDGKKVAEYALHEADENKLIMSMSGKKLAFQIDKLSQERKADPILQVNHLSRAGYYNDISFEIQPGEILGFYGLVGAGRSEVMKAIYGEMDPDEGEIIYQGEPISPKNSRNALDLGIVYVPEDRRHQGLFLIRSIRDNLSAGLLDEVSTLFGLINQHKEQELAQKQVDNFDIKLSHLSAHVSSLSGGNQQKVVLGRGLSHAPKLLILDEPTHGIDVATKIEIHKLIVSLAKENIAIILISSELPEVLSLSDSIIVMHEGEKMGYLSREELNEEEVLRLALGLNHNDNSTI